MIICVVLFMFSFGCTSTQPVPTTPDSTGNDDLATVKVYNPETGEYEDVPVVPKVMDTLAFEILDEALYPPISDESPRLFTEREFIPDLRSSYAVSVLLPFVSGSPPSPGLQINRKSLIAINFYAGLKMALDELEEEGMTIDLHVFDTEARASKVQSILRNDEVMQSNLIIGPYRNSSVSAAASFSKEYAIPTVSPFIPHETITSENPYFIQLNPGFDAHLKTILEHIKGQYDDDQVTLVALDNPVELSRLAKMQRIHQQLAGSLEAEPLRELIIDDEIAEEDYLPIDTTIFLENKTAVFVFPYWSREKEVYEFLRKVNLSKGIDNEMVVYGMPQWKEFDYYDYYERLNVHITTPIFLDEEDRRVGNFRREYYNKYGALPDENAYLGYDTMLYFGRQLKDYGANFHQVIDQHPEQMMTSKFAFERFKKDMTPEESELEFFDKYENKFLNMIRFEDYRYRRAN
ncbi:MAG: ABC transporter substrate-binding protein, partial [Bacteroidia bacterium]|nr:ABC transporter substrate-binding protein [Bacteroidia bacterium]